MAEVFVALSAVLDFLVSFLDAWAEQTKDNKLQSKRVFSGKLSNILITTKRILVKYWSSMGFLAYNIH